MTDFQKHINDKFGNSKDLFDTMINIVDTANRSFSGELLSHTDDPETSKIAAENHKLRAGSHAQKIFEFVKKYPDSTAGELGEMTGLGQHETARRLSDLFRKGYIVKGEPKRCNIKNTLMTAWSENATR
tara:strand:- start:488 stop:874 length:387 start_codon:yes stop_codon:yes gene_type:complete